jgi:hypothetical protein
MSAEVLAAEGPPKLEIKTELVKSFKNINYSQWERQRANNAQSATTNEVRNAMTGTHAKKPRKLFTHE